MRVGLLFLCACTATEAQRPEGAQCESTVPPRRLVRLTDRQHANAIRDLLGVEITPVRTPGQSDDPFVEASELLGVSGTLAHQYQQAAEEAARAFTGDLDRIAARAFRRPLTSEESRALRSLPDERAAIEAVLQHPAFLYRSELSSDLDPFELATALSFALLDSIPDEPLWEKALDGSLSDRRAFEAEVDRLLADPRARDNLTRLITDWLGARRILSVHRNPDLYPEFDDDTALAMYADVQSFVKQVLIEGGGPKDLLERGVLTLPGMITAYAHTDAVSVVHQGLFIRRAFLCGEPLTSPPSDLVRSVDAETQGLDRQQLAEFRLSHDACRGCHREIDPFGLPFLAFDSIGRPIGDRSRADALSHQLAEDGEVHRCVESHLAASMIGRSATCVANDGSFLGLFRSIVESDGFSRRSAP